MSYERTAELVKGSQNGDSEAVALLISLYGKMAYSVVRNLLYPSSDIDDVYQEAWLQAFATIRNLREPDKFGGWLKRIAIGKAIDHLRRRIPRGEVLLEHIPEPSGDDEAASEHLDVRLAVASLPLHYREVVVLYYWSGCTYAEIAEALSIPPGTVMSRLHAAKKIVAANLRERGAEWHGY